MFETATMSGNKDSVWGGRFAPADTSRGPERNWWEVSCGMRGSYLVLSFDWVASETRSSQTSRQNE